MKTSHIRTMVALLTGLVAVASVAAQQKPEYDMGKMQMLFLDQLPEWKTSDRDDEIRKEQTSLH